MFRGGTNFGFMNGAKIYHKHGYKPVVTSYGRYNLIGGKKTLSNFQFIGWYIYTPCKLHVIDHKNKNVNLIFIENIPNYCWINCVCLFFFLSIKTMFHITDYMAPLSEAGDTTEKYQVIRELLMKYQENVRHFHGATLKEIPENKEKAAYGTFPINTYLSFEDLLSESVSTFKARAHFTKRHNYDKTYR